jgi:hypothetical protein
MSQAVMALLERATRSRAAAERARRLSRSILTRDVLSELERHAADLERQAQALEAQARTLAAGIDESEMDAGLLAEEARLHSRAMRPDAPD